MPQALAAWVVAALEVYGTEAAIVTAAVELAVTVAISLAISTVAQALAGKPSATGTQPPSREVTSRGTIEFQQLIYGQVRTGGFLAFFGTSGLNNRFLWFVIVLAGHQCEAIDDLWLDSRHILDSDITGGAVTAAAFQDSGSRLFVWKHLGTGTDTVDAQLAADFPEWDSSHVGRGIPYVVYRLDRSQVAYPSGAPASFYALVKGRRLYDPRLDSTNGGSGSQRVTDPSTWVWSQNWALAVRDYLSGGAVVYTATTPDKRKAFGEADARIDDAYVISAANSSDEAVTVPLPVLAGTLDWTNASANVTGNGTLFTSMLAAGNKLIGPDGLTYTIAASPAITDTALTLTAPFAGTTVVNEITHFSTTGATSVTELRFTADCQLSCGNTHAENAAVLLSGGNGHISYVGGKYRIYAGVYTTPVVSLTQDDILGPIDVLSETPADQAWNYVDGTFFDENNGWAQMPFPAQQNSTYETDDGRQYPKSIDLQATRGNYRAQRLANVVLQQSRNKLTIDASQVSQRAMNIAEWETFFLTIPEYGWTNQIFRCVTWTFQSSGLIAMQCRAEGPTAYADPVVSAYVDPSTNNPPAFATSPPDAPIGIGAFGTMNGVLLTLAPPAYFPASSFLEIWEFTSNSPFSSATKVGQTRASSFTVPHSDTLTRFYWVTTGDANGGRSTSQPSGAGIAGTPLSSQFWSPQLRGNASSLGGTIYKNGGTNTWDSDATSAVPYTSISVEGTFGVAGADQGIGLASAVGSVLIASITSGYYAIYASVANGHTFAMVGTTILFTGASPVVGDRYRVSYDGFYVLFYINNALVAATPLLGAQLFIGLTIAVPNGSFTNVQVSASNIATPSAWRESANCVVSDDNAQKQGGTAAWDSAIVSVNGFPVCHMSAKVNSVATNQNRVLMGICSAPVLNPDNTTPSYSWYNDTGANVWSISESGVAGGSFSAPSISDVPWVTVDATSVKYFLNDPNNPVRTVAVSAGTWYGIAVFYDVGGGINSIDFGPTTTRGVKDTAQLGPNAATDVVTATLASATITTSAALVTTTLPAPKQDSLVIVTATFDGFWTSGLGLIVDLNCANVQSGPTSGGTVDLAHTPGAVSPGVRFTSQWEFPLAAGVAPVVKFSSLISGGGNGGVANVVVQHEMIHK